MQVHIQNDGPVTIPIDSPESLQNQKVKPAKPQKQPKKKKNEGENKKDGNEDGENKKDGKEVGEKDVVENVTEGVQKL